MDANGRDDGTRGSRRYILQSVEASLRTTRDRLGIDLYPLNQPDPSTPLAETLAALDDLVRAGKVRYVGHSNFAAWQLADPACLSPESGAVPSISDQNEYSSVQRAIDAELIPAAAHFGVGILPFFPLANDLLTGRSLGFLGGNRRHHSVHPVSRWAVASPFRPVISSRSARGGATAIDLSVLGDIQLTRHRAVRRHGAMQMHRAFVVLGIVAATIGSISAAGAAPSTAAARYPSVLTAGHTIQANSILVSPNRFVSLRMQRDGNLVLVAGGHVLWNARTHGSGNFAQLDRSGAFTVNSPARRALWTTRTSGFSAALRVGDDGNLALQTPNGTTLWTSNTRAAELDAANYLYAGQFLTGQRKDRLTQQSDGNLVMRRANGAILWNARSHGHPGAFTVLQRDGNLVTYAADGQVLWNSATAVPGARLGIDPSGILLLRRPDGSVEWSSHPPVRPVSLPQTAADYASAILKMWGGRVTGLAGAHSDLLATSRGQSITNSDSCGNTVRVDIRVVAFLYHVTSHYKILINNIITGHGCDAAHHPKGEATDIGGAWNLTTGAATSFGGYWGANNTTMDAQFASYASTILPVGSGLGQSQCPGTSSAQLAPGIAFFPDYCNHQHVQV